VPPSSAPISREIPVTSAAGIEGQVERAPRHGAEATHEPLLVKRPQLIEQDQSVLAAEYERNAIGRRAAADGHRRDRRGAQKFMHLRRRDDDARTGLLNFCADCRIERRKPNFTAENGNLGWRRGPAGCVRDRLTKSRFRHRCYRTRAIPARRPAAPRCFATPLSSQPAHAALPE
jgi:hypothetical protein